MRRSAHLFLLFSLSSLPCLDPYCWRPTSSGTEDTFLPVVYLSCFFPESCILLQSTVHSHSCPVQTHQQGTTKVAQVTHLNLGHSYTSRTCRKSQPAPFLLQRYQRDIKFYLAHSLEQLSCNLYKDAKRKENRSVNYKQKADQEFTQKITLQTRRSGMGSK
jgi:hypothetical protein